MGYIFIYNHAYITLLNLTLQKIDFIIINFNIQSYQVEITYVIQNLYGIYVTKCELFSK